MYILFHYLWFFKQKFDLKISKTWWSGKKCRPDSDWAQKTTILWKWHISSHEYIGHFCWPVIISGFESNSDDLNPVILKKYQFQNLGFALVHFACFLQKFRGKLKSLWNPEVTEARRQKAQSNTRLATKPASILLFFHHILKFKGGLRSCGPRYALWTQIPFLKIVRVVFYLT